MIYDKNFFILGVLIIIISLGFVLNEVVKNKKKNKIMKVDTKSIEYLDTIIDEVVTNYLIYEIQVQKVNYMNDKYYHIAIQEVTARVMSIISDNVKHNLYTCMTKEGLVKYIFMKITPPLSAMSIKKREPK